MRASCGRPGRGRLVSGSGRVPRPRAGGGAASPPPGKEPWTEGFSARLPFQSVQSATALERYLAAHEWPQTRKCGFRPMGPWRPACHPACDLFGSGPWPVLVF